MIDTLINFFKKPATVTQNETPEGICPICWGYQEYDKKIRKLYKDKQIDVNNHTANYAFIQDFVVNYIDGIKLKNEGGKVKCATCSTKGKV